MSLVKQTNHIDINAKHGRNSLQNDLPSPGAFAGFRLDSGHRTDIFGYGGTSQTQDVEQDERW